MYDSVCLLVMTGYLNRQSPSAEDSDAKRGGNLRFTIYDLRFKCRGRRRAARSSSAEDGGAKRGGNLRFTIYDSSAEDGDAKRVRQVPRTATRSAFVNRQSSIVNRQSPIANRQSSIVNRQSE
jgi:hypothetical protein